MFKTLIDGARCSVAVCTTTVQISWSRKVSFESLSTRGLTVELWVTPVDNTPIPKTPGPGFLAAQCSRPLSELGLPIIVTKDNPTAIPTSVAPLPVGGLGSACGHFRVLAVNGLLFGCDRNVVIYLSGDVQAIQPVCGEQLVYKCLIGKLEDVPCVELTYSPSLLELFGGCSGDGGGSVTPSYDPGSQTVTLRAELHGKVKCYGQTVADASVTITVSKRIGELTPCVDFDATSSIIGIKGKVCYAGSQICFTDLQAYIGYKGNNYNLDRLPSVCIPIPTLKAESCGCSK